ncbi:helix-turn-helix domain-containing protein [Actinoplanes sp. NPDC049118]|uniref:helix-turn-helix transcriptional regulator n=1 Tax=Actinoplanes sp. NPDC049118 TaxID=3155769 RepID=UPI0033F067EB
MTIAEVCEALNNLPRRTFYRWRELRIAPTCIKLPNNELRVWRSELNAWLEARREQKDTAA